MDISLNVSKSSVYTEVRRTTSYSGMKMTGEEGAFERIQATESDEDMLDRFWNECKSTICNSLKKKLVSVIETSGALELKLDVSSSFDTVLTGSMGDSLFSFFVMGITSKWFAFANKAEAVGYATEAAAYMDDIMRKAYFKKRPVRPTY